MKTQSVQIEIIGKEIEKGWFSNKHILVIQADEINNGKPVSRKVSREQYYSVDEGDEIAIIVYQAYNGRWFFTREEAESASFGY